MLGPMWIICVHWLCSVFHYMRTTHVNNNVTMPIENIGLMKNGKWSKGHNMSNVLCTKKFFIFPQSVNKTTKIKTLLLLESAQKHSLASQYFEMENWIKAICGINHKGRLGAPRSLSPWKAKIFLWPAAVGTLTSLYGPTGRHDRSNMNQTHSKPKLPHSI